ncbi:fibroblast growth factor binding protein 2a [Perca fluviatilis]|uniref:fibroblast growth factor binding protein 2a n=1 Tax=Perca fluviatilis TaxID=8168 RepID=UPI00196505BD|nr:fibroblast growth factor binding protein 2a [Perca fluviatilis]
MWTQDSALLLLLACCLWSAEAQSDGRQSIWDDPIKFKTKANDVCSMIITGQGEYTRLRLLCLSLGNKRSYWCVYIGKPHTCRAYNKNPRHYFVQMTWGLKKLQNACQAPRQIKPHMCRKATDDSQMVFSSASFPRSSLEASSRTGARPQPRPAPTRQAIRVPPQEKTTPRANPQPSAPPVESNAKRVARQYCWRSLQGICSYFIGFFRK